jgi:hypothetical protein
MKTKEQQERQIFLSHFHESINPKIHKYMDEVVLPRSKFIFTQRVKGIQFGYCTNCNDGYMTDNLKEGDEVSCKRCKADCTVKANGRSRKTLKYDSYVVYYEKSRTNPSAITATGYYIFRDYSNDYKDVQIIINARHRYVFEPGQVSNHYNFSYNEWRNFGPAKTYFGSSWYSGSYGSWTNTICSFESIELSVRDTPFQYSTWEQYTHQDMVKFFELFCKHPNIEYLTKLRMNYFVKAKLYGYSTYNAINWRGTTALDTLKITKQQINEIKEYSSKNELHPLTLRLQQIARKEQSNIPLSEMQKFAENFEISWDSVKRILKYTTIRRIDNYLKKQCAIKKSGSVDRYDLRYLAITWSDYISDCLKLELDLNNDMFLFPKDLHEAHQRLLQQVKHQGDALFNKKIAKRADALRKYEFELNSLFIRPAKSSNELIKEGKALVHCVANYAEKYANGSTIILLLRRFEEPDKPYFTVEIKKGAITQARGHKNKSYKDDPEALKFVNQFIEAKLTKPIKKESKAV